MITLDAAAIDAAAATNSFSGVVTVEVAGERAFERCYGHAHRGYGVPVTAGMQFGLASGSKAFTALAVLRLVEDGTLRLDQPAREILGDDLPLIDDAVTIEHLLGHTSGIGDYLDEDGDWEVDDYVFTLPVHTLTSAAAFLPALEGFPQKFAPGERFSYSNGGYMVLAVILERITGEVFHDVVTRLVLEPAGLADTAYLRLDELPGSAATGYVFDEGNRANTLHLPVLGNGDGGAFSTAADLHRFWLALHAGRIVSPATVATMATPRADVPEEGMRYGLGLWLHATGPATVIEGYDAGVSFRSTHIPGAATTATVLGNSSEGAWPVIGVVADAVDAALA
ncbi:MAG: beta-lactamase family protein [Tessaracoccus sp.]|uniref:serine hydrolase domain-containing protein n=1 Tax=Tessaracoccus sp. TaxID=1971211 RepID=UPI001ECCBA1E|nr:serine hydrolase domain-containing protein [Tessaracoccus sp.]MBK7822149.1 beta-lactamase family protein [Tessaracoccus sp.]